MEEEEEDMRGADASGRRRRMRGSARRRWEAEAERRAGEMEASAPEHTTEAAAAAAREGEEDGEDAGADEGGGVRAVAVPAEGDAGAVEGHHHQDPPQGLRELDLRHAPPRPHRRHLRVRLPHPLPSTPPSSRAHAVSADLGGSRVVRHG